MHPMEHLRLVARSGAHPGGAVRSVAVEAGAALAPVAGRPGGLLTACRRLVARLPGDGPLLWLAATALAASDPPLALGGAVDRLRSDPTGERAAAALPDGAVVVTGPGAGLGVGQGERGVQVVDGEPAAVVAADLVVCRACLWGPEEWLAPEGTSAFVDAASSAGAEVWVLAGLGTVPPRRMWELATDGLEPGSHGLELLDTSSASFVVGPTGRTSPERASARAEGPVVPELFAGGV
ncbi:MAG: hypothetical protein P6D49_03420 [Acidimicrobiales bacterium]|nr:hypothetical protein [Acidimicrobiales bacterium]